MLYFYIYKPRNKAINSTRTKSREKSYLHNLKKKGFIKISLQDVKIISFITFKRNLF